MESKELKDSIAEYELQLSRVEQTISACDDDEELTNLQSLRNDIKQLLNLTRENLSALQNRSTASTSVSSLDNSDPLADEYAMFMAEMAQSGAVEIKNADEDSKSELDVEDELKSMEGMKCQAPHKHNFGGIVYHNALIYNVISMESNQTFDEINVRVMFTNPTHQEMLPCPYYLETECKFPEDQCRYSHGEVVPLASLKEYKEPDFDLLKPGSRVIAKHHSKLWQRAVIKSLSDDHTCSIQFESNKQETEIDLSDVLPLQNDDEDNSSSSSDENSDSEETDNYKAALVQQSLFNTPTSQALGSWEKHTKGIGSKLMQQMGYVIGTGLGPKGDGRIEPVEAVILPTGKSLDHCMTLKENAGGDENLFKVERRMKKLQRKMEENSKKAYERDKQKTNVFKFLNDTLAVKVAPKTKDPCKPGFSRSKHRQELATETSRNLNITSLKIEEDIKKVERELWKINESLTRHSDENSVMNKTLKAKLISKQNELKNLKLCETNVNNEQCLRKDKKKLTVF